MMISDLHNNYSSLLLTCFDWGFLPALQKQCLPNTNDISNG